MFRSQERASSRPPVQQTCLVSLLHEPMVLLSPTEGGAPPGRAETATAAKMVATMAENCILKEWVWLTKVVEGEDCWLQRN